MRSSRCHVPDFRRGIRTGRSQDRLPRRLPVLLSVLLSLLPAIFPSCDSPAVPVSGKSRVRVDVDWSRSGGGVPAGMTVIAYHEGSGDMAMVSDKEAASAILSLPSGRHRITVFNLSEREFRNIRFRGLGSVASCGAYAAESRMPEWYLREFSGADYLAFQPEWLAVGSIMAETGPGMEIRMAPPEVNVAGTVHPCGVVHTLHVAVNMAGIGNLMAVRGAVGGLACGRKFAAGCPEDNSVTVTHLLESGSWTRTDLSRQTPPPPGIDTSDAGTVRSEIRCFGLPSNHGGTAGENRLELQALLSDGKTVVGYDIPVGHLIEKGCASRSGCQDLYLEVWLDTALPSCGGGGGIDVWLDDWDDYVDFYMPI